MRGKEGDGEVFQVKKSSLSQKLILGRNAAPSRCVGMVHLNLDDAEDPSAPLLPRLLLQVVVLCMIPRIYQN